MTDSPDFKAAKEWAKRNEEHFNTARVILALCELLKEVKPKIHCETASEYQALLARIKAAIGA